METSAILSIRCATRCRRMVAIALVAVLTTSSARWDCAAQGPDHPRQPSQRVSTSPSEAGGAMLDAIDRVRHIMRQATMAEVRGALADARRFAAHDPDVLTRVLLVEQARVRVAPELDPADRDALLDQLTAALVVVARQSAVKSAEQLQRSESQLIRAARGEPNRQLAVDQRAIEQHVARSNRLAAAGDSAEASAAARRAVQIDPTTAAGNMTTLEASLRGNIADARALRDRHWQGLQETNHADEFQHIPVADDPPIHYPPADEWSALRVARKKWEAASTYQPRAGEQRIEDALSEPTEIHFENTPLVDAIDYLAHKHDIEIQVDAKELSLDGVDPSAVVTRSVKGISLRSTLRLMLEDFGLTFVVRDGYLLITTKERADEMVTTRVYPVADLVIPIPQPSRGRRSGSGRWRP